MSGGFTPGLQRTEVGLRGKASFLASEQIRVKRGGITIDASLVEADANGDKILEEGTFLAEVTSTGKYGPYGTAGGVSDEVQTLTVTGEPTGGTFTLTYAGDTTAPIDFDASAAEVENALVDLATIGDGDVEVTKAGNVFTVRFGGEQANENVQSITATSSLTGGTTPGVTVATATAGGANQNDGTQAPSDDTSGYLLEGVNLRHGDVITGLLIGGSVLAARVTPAPDATIRSACKGRIQFQ